MNCYFWLEFRIVSETSIIDTNFDGLSFETACSKPSTAEITTNIQWLYYEKRGLSGFPKQFSAWESTG